ncbi:MAG: hypothetical protein R3E66_13130 [bacterium]
MAKPSLELIAALRATADRMDNGAKFHWNHMGSCNCGHLAQTLTRLSKAQIHRMAMENAGDWTEQAREFCPDSGYPLDRVIEIMVRVGLNTNDIANLERLSDPKVLKRLGAGELDYRNREDAVTYIRAWADLLEAQWREDFERRQARTRQLQTV